MLVMRVDHREEIYKSFKQVQSSQDYTDNHVILFYTQWHAHWKTNEIQYTHYIYTHSQSLYYYNHNYKCIKLQPNKNTSSMIL